MGSPPAGGTVRGWCLEDRAAVEGGGLDNPIPGHGKLALGRGTVTSLEGKEPEIVREVERFRLEIVVITSTHGWVLEPHSLREDGLFTTLELPMVRGGGLVVGLLIAPQLSRHVLEFTPVNERVISLRLRGIGLSLSCVPTAQTAVLSTRPSWCLWAGAGKCSNWGLHRSTGGLQCHVGSDSDTWRGVMGGTAPPHLNLCSVQLLDFCASYSLSITNTMFKH